MTSLESLKKTINDLFNWSNKQEQSNQPQTKSQNVQPSHQINDNKKIIKSQANSPFQPQKPKIEIQNQRKGQPLTLPVFKYLKNILIEQEVECPICLTKYKKPGIIKFGQCGHQYCPPCLRQYANQRLKNFGMIKCPDQNCQSILEKNTLFFKSLTTKQKKIADKIEKFHFTSNDPYLRMCPTQHCQGIIPVIEGQQLKCPICHNQFCKKCMYFKHSGKCASNQVTYLNEKYRYRKCGRCGIIVQKTQACNHITCKCGYQFCYGCGRRWPGNGHHCSPPRNNHQMPNVNNTSTNTQSESVIKRFLKVIGQIIMTIILLCGVIFYSLLCLFPMMIVTLVSGVIVGIVVYSIKFTYDTCKNQSPGLGLLLIMFFPLAMGFGVYEAFKAFWWDGFLFWWEILRDAIQKPLTLIWA